MARRKESKPHLYRNFGVWICIQWEYGRNATTDILWHGKGHTIMEAWNAMMTKKIELAR